MLWIGGFSAIMFLLFMFSYRRDPRRMINGFLFNACIVSFLLFCFVLVLRTDYPYSEYLILFPVVALVILIPFGSVALVGGLLYNAKLLMQREGKKLANSLTMLTGLGFILLFLLNGLDLSQYVSVHFRPLFSSVYIIAFYFFIHLLNFFTAYVLYQFNRPKHNQDFIIVLGSGLINDDVPPLLASRINKAMGFYYKQKKVTTPPKIIFSGGQGSDENRSEAEAMEEYAIQHGIPAEDTLQEKQSLNTYQNMAFSKALMDQLRPDGNYESIFTTNNFHLFRAGLYARKAGLKSQGIGSKTALYYWPNAMVREYIAIVALQRKRHMIVIASILLLSLCLSVFSYLFIDYQ
ncbi:YdcF family protein [Shouchella hunanensis]|uniref:YdcF family protein n=1 Tax=Shouchella hunanensis TaxID=766894 RepID=A0ABY7W8M8_9BACI|nr:YdcF family protein [Shouchella hunanensis]WDF05282.1 YdcF family protein [Shouchella hunanensis]